MPAGVYNILIESGATFTLPLVFKDGSGNPVNLTGYTARMQLRVTADAAAPLLTLSTDAGAGITLGGATGEINITVTAAQTAALAGAGVYDLLLTTGSVARRVVQGTYAISQGVTR